MALGHISISKQHGHLTWSYLSYKCCFNMNEVFSGKSFSHDKQVNDLVVFNMKDVFAGKWTVSESFCAFSYYNSVFWKLKWMVHQNSDNPLQIIAD